MKNVITLVFMLLASASALADSIQCIPLVEGDTIFLELKKATGFKNCFSLQNLKQNTPVNFVMLSQTNLRTKIILLNVDEAGIANYVSEYSSKMDGELGFSVNSTDRNLAFQIIPTSHLNTSKNTSITYLEVDNVAQLIVDFSNATSTYAPPPSPPSQGSCRSQVGVRNCNNAK